MAQACRTPRGPNASLNSGFFGVVGVLRFLLGVQVVEIAEELVEAMHGGQVLVEIAEMVLAELPGRIAQGLQQISYGRIFRLQTKLGAWHADLGQASAGHFCIAHWLQAAQATDKRNVDASATGGLLLTADVLKAII